jgi:hypothetical protein
VLRLDPSFDMTAEDIVKDPSTLSSGALRDSDDAHAKKLGLDQRAVILAAAISIDFGTEQDSRNCAIANGGTHIN